MKPGYLLASIFISILFLSPSAEGVNDTIWVERVTVSSGIEYSFSIDGYLNQPLRGFEIPLSFSSYDLVFDSASLSGGIVPSGYEISWRTDNDSTHFLLFIFPLIVNPPPPNIEAQRGKICDVFFSVRDFAPDQIVFIDTAGYPLYIGDSLVQYYDLIGYDTTGTNPTYPEYVYGTISIFTDVWEDDSEGSLPDDFRLFQNYPNPFNPITRIAYQVPFETDVALEILNLLGQEVETFHQGTKQPGYHEIYFDASGLKSGFYLYRIRAGDFIETRKMLLLK